MISNVEIADFRGVERGGIGELSPLSILVGPNNCGKSTVLEALLTLASGPDLDIVARHLIRRGGAPLDALAKVVRVGADRARLMVLSEQGPTRRGCELSLPNLHDVERMREARAEGLGERNEELTCRWLTVGQGPGPEVSGGDVHVLVDSDGKIAKPFAPDRVVRSHNVSSVDVTALREGGDLNDAYSKLQSNPKLFRQVIAALQTAMPGLDDLRILLAADVPTLNTFIGNNAPVPAYLAGDGLKRFLALGAALAPNPSPKLPSITLLEEPESFQHPRYLKELVTLLLATASEKHQVVLATHSIELLDLLLHAAGEEKQFPTVHRLRLEKGVLSATTLTHSQALAARDEISEDLRA